MNDQDRQILTDLQKSFPLTTRPFDRLAEQIGVPPDLILEAVRRLKQEGYIRQISAIFDSGSLGYSTSLVALKAAPDRVESAAEVINQHPCVSHNYLRNHEYNIWFTIATPPGHRYEDDLAILAKEAAAEDYMPLPTLRLYKIGVQLDLTQESHSPRDLVETRSGQRKPSQYRPLTEVEKRAVLVLQKDLTLNETPFDAPAVEAGLSVEQLFAVAEQFQEEGRMRRFSAVIRHRKAGFSANGMVTWVVPEDARDTVGEKLAQFQAVSHCYRRPTFPNWPYSLFTMVHAKSEAQCEEIAKQMADTVGIQDYTILYSSREFKKERVAYFTDAYDCWRASHSGS